MAYPVSSRWDAFVRRGFHPITRIDVQYPGEGIVLRDLPVSEGSLTFTRRSNIRASGHIIVPDPELFPALNDSSVISPYGAEVVIYTGTLYPEGVGFEHLSREELVARNLAELVPLGVFVIWSGGGSEKQGNATKLTLYDRAKIIGEGEHVFPTDYGGSGAFETIEALLKDTSPAPEGIVSWDVHFDPALTDIVLPAGTTFDMPRWRFINQIAESIGAEVYFGRDGDAYVVPVPGVGPDTNTFDWLVDAGENGVLVDINRSLDRPPANGVVVTGSTAGDGPQPYAFVTDQNPASRTVYGGGMGKVVKRFDMSELTSDAECETAAEAKLRDLTGLQRKVDFQTFGNPAMDPGDVVLIRGLSGPDEFHLLGGYEYNLRTTEMLCETRSVQFVE